MSERGLILAVIDGLRPAALEQAVAQAEEEFRLEVGKDVATVVSLGLEAYATSYR